MDKSQILEDIAFYAMIALGLLYLGAKVVEVLSGMIPFTLPATYVKCEQSTGSLFFLSAIVYYLIRNNTNTR